MMHLLNSPSYCYAEAEDRLAVRGDVPGDVLRSFQFSVKKTP